MRGMKGWLLGVLLMPAVVWAQEAEVKRERTFTGAGLYGYMNGGAEQFLEYGVSRLVVRDIVYKGEEYTIEVYDMPSPEDAFGIYSLHVFRCARADTLGCIDCLSPYQLQTVAGSRYVSVVFPSGSAKAQAGADEVIRLYVSPEGEGRPKIPEKLSLGLPYSGRLKYLRGPISVSGVSMSLASLLQNTAYRGVWFIAEKADAGFRAWIEWKNPADKERVKTRLSEGNLFRSSAILSEGEDYLYFSAQEKEEEGEEGQGGFGF